MLRIYDIGYYGESHSQIGIILKINEKHENIIVLDITDPFNRKEVSIHRETFVPTKNLEDAATQLQSNDTSTETGFDHKTPTATFSVVKKTERLNTNTLNHLKSAHHVLMSRETHKRRMFMMSRLMHQLNKDPDQYNLSELKDLIGHPDTVHNRIITIRPETNSNDNSLEVWVLRISKTLNQLTVFEISARYETIEQVTGNKTLGFHSTHDHSTGIPA